MNGGIRTLVRRWSLVYRHCRGPDRPGWSRIAPDGHEWSPKRPSHAWFSSYGPKAAVVRSVLDGVYRCNGRTHDTYSDLTPLFPSLFRYQCSGHRSSGCDCSGISVHGTAQHTTIQGITLRGIPAQCAIVRDPTSSDAHPSGPRSQYSAPWYSRSSPHL